MVKFSTQFKRTEGGNIHFSFLATAFGPNAFLICILGLVFTISFKNNK
jgi:hypothetical protein